jgi:hypothetical protein
MDWQNLPREIFRKRLDVTYDCKRISVLRHITTWPRRKTDRLPSRNLCRRPCNVGAALRAVPWPMLINLTGTQNHSSCLLYLVRRPLWTYYKISTCPHNGNAAWWPNPFQVSLVYIYLFDVLPLLTKYHGSHYIFGLCLLQFLSLAVSSTFRTRTAGLATLFRSNSGCRAVEPHLCLPPGVLVFP